VTAGVHDDIQGDRMSKRLLACVLGALALLLAAPALAAEPPPAGVQTADQSATGEQGALAASEATQTTPSNTNISIRVFSPGDDGSVTQSNDVSSKAEAENDNDTEQDADQFQGSHGKRCGCSDDLGIQVIGQSAKNKQLAAALSAAFQLAPKNSNAPVSVWSRGDAGSVDQSNSADSRGEAENDNELEQLAQQFQL
jgi:hypothetical protein